MKAVMIVCLMVIFVVCCEAQRPYSCNNIRCNTNSGLVCANGRRFSNDCMMRRSLCRLGQAVQLERCPTRAPQRQGWQRQQPYWQQYNNQQRRQPNYNPRWNNQGYNQGYNQQRYPVQQNWWGQQYVDPEEQQEAFENQRENQQESYENQQEAYENQQEAYENQQENQEEGGNWYNPFNSNYGRRNPNPQNRGWQQGYNQQRQQWAPMNVGWGSLSREVDSDPQLLMAPLAQTAGGNTESGEDAQLLMDPLAQTAGGNTESREDNSEEVIGGSPNQSSSSPSESTLSAGPFGSI